MTTVKAFNHRFELIWNRAKDSGADLGVVNDTEEAVQIATENLMLDSELLGRRWAFITTLKMKGLVVAGVDGAVVLLQDPCNLYAVGSYATTKAWLDKVHCSEDFVMFLMIGDVSMVSLIEILDAAVADEDKGLDYLRNLRRQMNTLTNYTYSLDALCV